MDAPHRRFNPLTGQWVLVSAGRTTRPWQGQQEQLPREASLPHDPDCYLCPGNLRASGDRNPQYEATFVFDNDFAALRPDTPDASEQPHRLLRAHAQPGVCRVLCFAPRHDLTLAQMALEEVAVVVDLWAQQAAALADYAWVQIFENRGAAMGASNPHPHGQVWASAAVPNVPANEDRHQAAYLDEHGTPLLVDYVSLESERAERVVVGGDHWVAVVPYWAVWPFETLLLPRDHVTRLPDLTADQRRDLAAVLRALLIRYDNLFEHPFPYSMGWHAAPNNATGDAHWQLHGHIYPPLLRSPTVRKFLVGYEMLGEEQRDLTAEDAAARLRALPDVHYTVRHGR